MTKEEILQQSKNENKKCDPFEMDVNKKAGIVGLIVAAAFAFIVYVVQIIIGKGQNNALLAVIFLMAAGESVYRYIKLKGKINLTLLIAYSLCAVCYIVSTFIDLFA